MCIVRIIEQWDALTLYFTSAAQTDRLLATENVAKALHNPIFKLYFEFLAYILPKFTEFNKLYQSEKPNLHCVTSDLSTLYKSLLSCYMSSTYIRCKPLSELDPSDATNMLPLTAMYMGHKVSSELVKPEIRGQSEMVRGFLEHCQQLYIEGALQVKKRFPISDPILSSMVFLNPALISCNQCADVVSIALKFPNIVPPSHLDNLESEWRNLAFTEIPFHEY